MRRSTSMALLAVLGVAVSLVAMGCEMDDAMKQDSDYASDNQSRLMKAVPAPAFTDSQERRNMVRRYQTFNTASKVSYIYLLSDTGVVISFYTVKGKVSSVNSLLLAPERLAIVNGAYERVPSPQPDGSYGTNGDAIFFYTTEGAYVEWNGKYMQSDQPLQLATKPILFRRLDR